MDINTEAEKPGQRGTIAAWKVYYNPEDPTQYLLLRAARNVGKAARIAGKTTTGCPEKFPPLHGKF